MSTETKDAVRVDAEPSLTEVLAILGWTHEPASGLYRRTVRDAYGAELVTGTAGEVWAWLRANAPVFAAAPALLDALSSLEGDLTEFDWRGLPDGTHATVRAAIRLATEGR